jgi:hypothetical protein
LRHPGLSLGVRLQVFLAPGEQVTALAGLGVGEASPQHLDGGARRALGAQRLEGGGGLLVRALADQEERQRHQCRQRERERTAAQQGKQFQLHRHRGPLKLNASNVFGTTAP